MMLPVKIGLTQKSGVVPCYHIVDLFSYRKNGIAMLKQYALEMYRQEHPHNGDSGAAVTVTLHYVDSEGDRIYMGDDKHLAVAMKLITCAASHRTWAVGGTFVATIVEAPTNLKAGNIMGRYPMVDHDADDDDA